VRLDANGAESAEAFSLADIDNALMQSRCVALEGPAGRGKTTTLIQLAERARASDTTFHRRTSSLDSSSRGMLEYIAGKRPLQAEGLKADRAVLFELATTSKYRWLRVFEGVACEHRSSC